MRIQSIIGATSAWILFITSTPAAATVIYTYTGNVYDMFSGTGYTTDMFVSGTVQFDAPLPNGASTKVTPKSFSFFDGINTITSTNADASFFEFSLDGTGEIIGWSLQVDDDRSLEVEQAFYAIGTAGDITAPFFIGSIDHGDILHNDPSSLTHLH